MSDACIECGGKCCKYFCFEIDEPDSYEEFEDVRWYLCHEGVSVHVDEDGDWYIALENRCRNLTAIRRCSIYESRPLICRKYDADSCDRSGGEYKYRHVFRTPEQLEAYARRTLGEAEYETSKVKALAELENRKKSKRRRRAKTTARGPVEGRPRGAGDTTGGVRASSRNRQQ